jgi:cytosine/adenosine deaminase-related metal-dependent hydrolase
VRVGFQGRVVRPRPPFIRRQVKRLGDRRIGVADGLYANMRLGSGSCRVGDLPRAGTKVTIGVDGSPAKDSGHLLGEVRNAGGRFVDLDLDSLIADTPHGRGAVTRLCDFLAKGATRRGAGNKRLHVRRRSGDIAGSHAKLPLQS